MMAHIINKIKTNLINSSIENNVDELKNFLNLIKNNKEKISTEDIENLFDLYHLMISEDEYSNQINSIITKHLYLFNYIKDYSKIKQYFDFNFQQYKIGKSNLDFNNFIINFIQSYALQKNKNPFYSLKLRKESIKNDSGLFIVSLDKRINQTAENNIINYFNEHNIFIHIFNENFNYIKENIDYFNFNKIQYLSLDDIKVHQQIIFMNKNNFLHQYINSFLNNENPHINEIINKTILIDYLKMIEQIFLFSRYKHNINQKIILTQDVTNFILENYHQIQSYCKFNNFLRLFKKDSKTDIEICEDKTYSKVFINNFYNKIN